MRMIGSRPDCFAEVSRRACCGAGDEGDTREIEMRILGTPTAGHTLRVQIIDNNPPGSSSAMDELRFRGRSYPVGTQAANMYVICIDTSYEPEKVVIQWEVRALFSWHNSLFM